MSTLTNPKLRNIAIIAHVDHGKTTLVDHMLRQAGTFRAEQQVADRLMDNMDLERERGITIAAKNCAIRFGDTKINILDTPGHADFGGEVERAMSMVDGAILLVDSSEGPLPQTRFVLRKALEANLKIVIAINKIDRKDARPDEVLKEIQDLLIDLDANDEQLDSPVIYAIGREGIARRKRDGDESDLRVLFEEIVRWIPAPSYKADEPFQMLVSNLAYSEFVGRLAVGKVHHGSARKNEQMVCINKDGEPCPLRIAKLQVYEGVRFQEVDQVEPGDIIIVAGIEDVEIGDTICTKERPKALKRLTVDEPTISMRFSVNTSPLAGREGKFVVARKIYERLYRETLNNVGIHLQGNPEDESFIIKGRGEFQMAILIETMRREGFELSVSRPEIIFKEENGKKLEPIEHVFIDCDEGFIGVVTERLATRKGKMSNMVNNGSGRVRLEFSIPSRGLIGYRNDFLTDTKGTGLMSSYVSGYEEYRGEFLSRKTGSLVADRTGEAIPYAIFHLEPRGTMFVKPGDPVYEGMIIGEHSRDNDLDVNICKEKKLTNIRAANKDENIMLTPVTPMTIERAIEFIRADELVEATPSTIRLRKAILPANKR
jgi:GTP-binding protein